jgi:hypothetical protein
MEVLERQYLGECQGLDYFEGQAADMLSRVQVTRRGEIGHNRLSARLYRVCVC